MPKFLIKSRIIWSNYDHNQQSTIKNSRLHLIACNRNKRSASHAMHMARHFMHHFTSFYVIFHIISCHILYISLHISHTHHTHITHVAHYAFREQRAFHTLHHTSRHFMCHFISFSHEISYHTHSYHLGMKRVEIGSKRHTLQLGVTWVGRSIQRIKTPPEWGVFTNDKGATSSRRFISLVQFRPRVPFFTKTSSCISSNSYPRVVQGMLSDHKLLEES